MKEEWETKSYQYQICMLGIQSGKAQIRSRRKAVANF